MHRHYIDILSRITEPPTWFDELAVPRFGAFAPAALADIYADECALMEIRCQACGQSFQVAMSTGSHEYAFGKPRLSADVSGLHYGDPPNMQCCAPGPTMSSEPIRVLEFWTRDAFDWIRQPLLEGPIGEATADVQH